MPGTYISPADLGFYYLNSRYYDPVVGRFINADSYISTGQGLLGNNMFAYCNNSPIVMTDPQGTICYYFDENKVGGGNIEEYFLVMYGSYAGYGDSFGGYRNPYGGGMALPNNTHPKASDFEIISTLVAIWLLSQANNTNVNTNTRTDTNTNDKNIVCIY